jgi:predicted alpha/beta superfamily hydrolase
MRAGKHEFKFTRGDWGKVEKNAAGGDVPNHVLEIGGDTTVQYTIGSWGTQSEKVHTASAQVHVIDTAFAVPQLNTTRRIWIYLPKGYQTSNKRFPVLYMHDGQNLFDAYTSGYGEWGVDEILDSLQDAGKGPAIVVGIDNGPERINEYIPFDDAKYGKAKGDAYVDFLVKTLKPFIDKHYRTLPAANQTAIAGSSLGGLISYYAVTKYPQTFGKAGIFSPSFWIAPQLYDRIDSLPAKMNNKLFFYIGEKEGAEYVKDMTRMEEKLAANTSTLLYSAIDPDGVHNEFYWHKWFPEFYNWIMADWTNYIIRPKP